MVATSVTRSSLSSVGRSITRWSRLGRLLGTGFVASSLLFAAGCGSGAEDNDSDDDDDSGGKGGSGARGGSGGTGGSGARGGSGGSGGGIPPEPEAEWTFFVYGHGDHNLSNSLLVDLREMAQADLGSAGTINVIAFTDWDSSQAIADSDPPSAFPDGVQIFRIPGGGADLEVIAEGPELGLDDPDVLASVVADVFTAFPARRRAIVLWDHGGSWSGGFGSDSQNGTVAGAIAMAPEAIPGALQAGLEAAGVTDSPPLDIVAFDTCLMAGAEVAYPFRELAQVYIANAEIDYGAGWDYATTLSYIAANATDDALALARAEVGHYDAHHAQASPNDSLLRAHAAFDLSAMDALAEATRAFTDAVAASSSFDATDLGRSGFFALPPYASQFETASSSIPGLRDMGQVLDALGESTSDPDVASAAAAASQALADTFVAASLGSLREDAGQVGFHVELSLASQLTADKRASYGDRASGWAAASGWEGVLETLVAGADEVGPTFSHSVANGDGASRSAPPILALSTPDRDAARGAVYLGTPLDASTILMLGLIGSGTLESDTAYEFAWDGSVATFPDGQIALLDIWLDTGPEATEPVLMVPGLLDGAAPEPLITYLVFTPSEAAASVAVVSLGSVASTLSLGEIAQAAPEATFTPLYFGIDTTTGESGLLTGDPMALPASGAYAFDIEYVNAGSYFYFTSLTDVWGNQSAELDTVELLEPLGP